MHGKTREPSARAALDVMAFATMTSVLIVDDHPIVMQGCRLLLQDIGIDRIYEANSVVTGFRSFLRHNPDIAIVDLTLEGDDLGGLSLISRISSAEKRARVLAFSMHDDPTIVSRALENGALSYVLKDTPSSELATAFEMVLENKPYLSHKLAMQLAMLRSKGAHNKLRDLTSREVQILSLLGRGNSYDQIAPKLGISYKTVTNACSTIRSKLKIKSLGDLIRFAIFNDPDRGV